MQIVTVVLESYRGSNGNLENLNHEGEKGPQNMWVQEVLKTGDHISPLTDVEKRIPSWNNILNDKGEVNVTT